MAVALNNTSTGTISGTSPLTISHTVGSGSNRYLEVTACCTNSSDFLASATVTYGGVSMGSPIVTAVVGSSNRFTYLWGMVAPTSGTANVVITPSSGAFLDAIVRDYAGVDQSTPVASSTKYANLISSPLPSQTLTCPSGGLLADFLTVRATGQTLTPGASQSQSGSTIAGGVSTSAGSTKASSDLSWSAWTGSQGVAHVGIALNASVSSTLSGNVTLDDIVGAGTLASSSSDLGGNVTLSDVVAAGTLGATPAGWSIPALTNWSGTLQASVTIPVVTFQRLSDGVQVLVLTSQTTNGAGTLSGTSGSLSTGTTYMACGWNADGSQRFAVPVTAT